MFYNKLLYVFNMGEGYEDEDHIHHDGTWKYTKNIVGDVQPYSAELAKREYGFEVQTTKRVFYDQDDDIKEGTVIVYKNTVYEVKKIAEWDDYIDIMIDDTVMPEEVSQWMMEHNSQGN
jgi:hypothetical protein